MQNNKMLQARHRYLQARRNLEYQQLKEAEIAAQKARHKEALQNVVIESVELMNQAVCPNCKKAFKDKRGLSSHIRRVSCEGT